MATQVIASVGTGASRDFATLSEAFADIPSSLVSADEQWTLVLYNDDLIVEPAALALTKTTDTTRFVEIVAASGHSIADDPGPLWLDTSRGVTIQLPQTINALAGFLIDTRYTRVRGIQFTGDSSGTLGGLVIQQSSNGRNCHFTQNVLHNVGSASALYMTDLGVTGNCLLIKDGSSGPGLLMRNWTGAPFADHVTVVGINGASGIGVESAQFVTARVRNVVVAGFTSGFGGSGSFHSTESHNNVSEDTTGPGTDPTHNASGLFVAANDRRLTSNITGTTVSSVGGIDFFGATRANPPTVGAAEYVEVGGGDPDPEELISSGIDVPVEVGGASLVQTHVMSSDGVDVLIQVGSLGECGVTELSHNENYIGQTLSQVLSVAPQYTWKRLLGTGITSVLPDAHDHMGGQGFAGLNAYSGMTLIPGGMFHCGGGHGDYGGNEVYFFSFEHMAWQRKTDPSAYEVDPNFSGQSEPEKYFRTLDGTPVSRHTYDILCWIPTIERMWMLGGALYQIGTSYDPMLWYWDPSTCTWEEQIDATGSTDTDMGSAWDPVNEVVLFTTKNRLRAYDPATQTIYNISTLGDQNHGRGASILDTERRRFVQVRPVGQARNVLAYYDVDAGTDRQYATVTGIDIEDWPDVFFSIVYAKDRYWLWFGEREVFEVDPDTWVASLHEPSGEEVPTNPYLNSGSGLYGRWQYVPEYDAIFAHNRVSNDVFFFSLAEIEDLSSNGVSVPIEVGSGALTQTHLLESSGVEVPVQIQGGVATQYGALISSGADVPVQVGSGSLVQYHLLSSDGVSVPVEVYSGGIEQGDPQEPEPQDPFSFGVSVPVQVGGGALVQMHLLASSGVDVPIFVWSNEIVLPVVRGSMFNLDQAFIQEVLDSNLELDIVFENGSYASWSGSSYVGASDTYKPRHGRAYLEARVLQNDRTPYGLSRSDETDGILQVIVRYPEGSGAIEAKKKSEEIFENLGIGKRILYEGVRATVTRHQRQPGVSEKGWYKLTTIIGYRAFLRR